MYYTLLLLITLFPTAVRAEGTKTVYLNFGDVHEATAQHYADILMKDSDYVLSASLSGTVMTLTLDADAAQDKTVQNIQYDLYRQLGNFKEEDGKQLYVFVQNSNTDMYLDNGPGAEMSKETPLPDTLTLYGFYRLPILTNAITVKTPKYGSEIKEGDVPSITLEGDTADAYLVTSSRWAKEGTTHYSTFTGTVNTSRIIVNIQLTMKYGYYNASGHSPTVNSEKPRDITSGFDQITIYHPILVEGFDWDKPTYTWAEDNSYVHAEIIGKSDPSCREEEYSIAEKTTRKPSCEEWGEITYTAEFKNPLFETQTKTVQDGEPLGHDWNEPVYTWADDNSSVTAERTCKRDESHNETETVKTTAKVTKAAACDAKGETTYTAEFTNEAFKAQTKTVEDIEALGHDWVEWVIVKEAEVGKEGLKERTCKYDPSHKETEVIPALDPVMYTITLDLSGGTLDGKSGKITISAEEGSVIILPKPSRTGYVFDYWKGSRYEAGASYKVEGDHTLTAQWKKTTPNTGDRNQIVLYSAMLAACLAVIAYAAGRLLKRS